MKPLKNIVIVVVLLIFALGGISTAAIYYGAARWKSPQAKEIVIKQGASLRSIAQELSREKVIGTPKLFEIIARARGLNRTLRAGTYEFPAGITIKEVLRKIANGDVKQYAFTIIEGATISDIAASLVNQPFADNENMPQDFVRLAHDPQFISSLGFEGIQSLEGYLFPETYLMDKPINAEKLIRRLTAQFRQVWEGLQSKRLSNKSNNMMSQNEEVTLASIVEKETGAASERPLIASVFLNRLKARMPLQSDPTTIYGLPNFDGNLHKQDMSNPHPYNTYVHPGLPPGPICNPGKASIEAVLHPAQTDYLYFVAKGDGTHKFSATLGEHAAAVEQYQIEPARRNQP